MAEHEPLPYGDCQAVPLLECTLPESLVVTVVDKCKQHQCQWEIWALPRCIFRTKDFDQLREYFRKKKEEINDFHRSLWPGFPIPPLLRSKHDCDTDDTDQGQGVYLKHRTVPTSLAFPWMSWAVSRPRRMPQDRSKSQRLLRAFLEHVLEKAGTLTFRVKRIGHQLSRETTVQVTQREPCFDSTTLWTRPVHVRLQAVWEAQRTDRENVSVQSMLSHPHWADLILFGMDPNGGARVIKPLSYTLFAQLAHWVDNPTNMSSLALTAEEFEESRQKNRIQGMAVNRQALMEAILYALYENATRLSLK